jgi:hypothetical protein
MNRAIVPCASFAIFASACVSAAAPAVAVAVHRPERIEAPAVAASEPETADALASSFPSPRPERIAPPVAPVVEIAPVAADVGDVEVPPPPAPGTYVLPERVELEDDVATTHARPPIPPRSRRRPLPPTSSMGDPVFSSSIFTEGDSSSEIQPPPLVH